MFSPDGRTLAYIRDDHGRGTLLQYPGVALTPSWMNVLDAAPTSGGEYFVAASVGWSPVELFRVDRGQEPKPMKLGEARDPAVSPDGRWLAYSRFGSGAWNLYLLDLRQPGVPRRLTDAACNQLEPAWEPDSKTLLYASDCGRALGFTAICRRRVIP
jgi:Tol biopolymer transport system component